MQKEEIIGYMFRLKLEVIIMLIKNIYVCLWIADRASWYDSG